MFARPLFRSARPRRGDHRRRDVDGDHATTERCSGERERARAGTEVDDGALAAEPALEQIGEVGLRVEVRLSVVALDVAWVEVLRPGVFDLFEQSGEEHRVPIVLRLSRALGLDSRVLTSR